MLPLHFPGASRSWSRRMGRKGAKASKFLKFLRSGSNKNTVGRNFLTISLLSHSRRLWYTHNLQSRALSNFEQEVSYFSVFSVSYVQRVREDWKFLTKSKPGDRQICSLFGSNMFLFRLQCRQSFESEERRTEQLRRMRIDSSFRIQ